MAKTKRTELQLLENYRITFENVENVALIKSELAEFGYDENKIAEGRALYQEAQRLFDQNKAETEEEKQAYAKFQTAYTELGKTYTKHRKSAKVALMTQQEAWTKFRLATAESDAYLQWVDDVKTFYTQVRDSQEHRAILEQFKITSDDAQTALTQIAELQNLRTIYEKERGESQDATQNKNKAFGEIAQWMKQFFAVAKIALDDHPQLLEALKRVVKS